MRRIGLILLAILLTSPVFSQIIHVPEDQTSIKSGIDMAEEGDTILVAEGASHQLDLSLFPKGVYFITIKSEDFITTEKFIKL